MNDSRLLLQEFHTLLGYLDPAVNGNPRTYSMPMTEMYRQSLIRRIETELMDKGHAYVDDDLKRDAERYRFLRDVADPDDGHPAIRTHEMNSWGKWYYSYDTGEGADNKVDAAMRQCISPGGQDKRQSGDDGRS